MYLLEQINQSYTQQNITTKQQLKFVVISSTCKTLAKLLLVQFASLVKWCLIDVSRTAVINGFFFVIEQQLNCHGIPIMPRISLLNNYVFNKKCLIYFMLIVDYGASNFYFFKGNMARILYTIYIQYLCHIRLV